MNIAFIPIDNRPVCYTLVEQICAINSNIKLFMPEREFLGSLTKYANVDKIFNWLENLPELDVIVMCLDTVAYGGLISSRRSPDSFENIKARVEKLKSILEKKNAKIYAFSSIMRISNNNVNEEEKEYWNKWGKKIFDYSYQTHKLGTESCITNIIPSEILDDYLATRKRNFEINKLYLEYQKQGIFDTLVFSKDDCAEYGFNVQEAQTLEKLGGFVKTGADEIPLTLLARAVASLDVKTVTETASRGEKTQCPHQDNYTPKIKIAPIFLAPDYKDLISNYEDVSIEKSVKGQIELAGCKVCNPEDADILLYVNNFEEHQGEIVMKVPTKPFNGKWEKPQKPYMIADVRYANGADNAFVKQLFDVGFDENFLGYSAWNTSANTLGSLICGGIVYLDAQMSRCIDAKSVTEIDARQNPSLLGRESSRSSETSYGYERGVGEKQNTNKPLSRISNAHECSQRIATSSLGEVNYQNNFPEIDHASTPPSICASNLKKLQAIRLLDDWAYQANVRQQLTLPDEKQVKELMKPYEKKVFEVLGVQYDVSYKFPWNRLFEVEVCI